MNISMYCGGFTSKRGISWSYNIGCSGFVEQYHPTTVRCTGGWKAGPDVFAREITQECFAAIEARYGFKRDPQQDDKVIVTDLSQDELIETFTNKYTDVATISRTPDGKIRLVDLHCGHSIVSIKIFDTVKAAEDDLEQQFWGWYKKEE